MSLQLVTNKLRKIIYFTKKKLKESIGNEIEAQSSKLSRNDQASTTEMSSEFDRISSVNVERIIGNKTKANVENRI